MRIKGIYGWVLSVFMLASCSTQPETKVSETEKIDFTLQRSLPHDVKAFTQGLLIHNGQLYESTGQENSWIGVVDVQTGIAERKVTIDDKYFGEGIVVLNNKVYQLTWRHNVGFVYDLKSFEKISEFKYEGEGWGLTTDGKDIIMSNGTEVISFLDSASLKATRTISVTAAGSPVQGLNELEYADGYLYANVWRTEIIVKIDPATGNVLGYLDLSLLARQARSINPQVDVLNGIAWHPATRTMLVTGKYWPYIFILKIKDKEANP